LKRIRLDLSYDGRDFHGFQSQPDGCTIQDAIEHALNIASKGSSRITTASRTDSGVSAEHQVNTCEVPIGTDLFKLKRSLNGLLPKSIRIQSVSDVANDFHPGFSAKAKIYRYRIWVGECCDPFCLPFVWELKIAFDIDKLNENLSLYVGKHDFKAFSNVGTDVKSTEREIFAIALERRGPLLNIWILGDGFLKQMIRNMVGTSIDICIGKLGVSLPELLKGKDRIEAGRTAPASGLGLVRIFYDTVPDLKEFIREYNSSGTFIVGGTI
jgi:tRNA pseudouridine38-40 synthase